MICNRLPMAGPIHMDVAAVSNSLGAESYLYGALGDGTRVTVHIPLVRPAFMRW